MRFRRREEDTEAARLKEEELYRKEYGIVEDDFQCRLTEGHRTSEMLPHSGHIYTTDDRPDWRYQVAEVERCKQQATSVYDIMIHML